MTSEIESQNLFFNFSGMNDDRSKQWMNLNCIMKTKYTWSCPGAGWEGNLIVEGRVRLDHRIRRGGTPICCRFHPPQGVAAAVPGRAWKEGVLFRLTIEGT